MVLHKYPEIKFTASTARLAFDACDLRASMIITNRVRGCQSWKPAVSHCTERSNPGVGC